MFGNKSKKKIKELELQNANLRGKLKNLKYLYKISEAQLTMQKAELVELRLKNEELTSPKYLQIAGKKLKVTLEDA